MSRIADCFEKLRTDGRKGLITFITAGDPSPSATPDLMHALVRGGADVIELGVPFSDPMADGEVIQRASERALQQGVSLNDVFAAVRSFRQRDTNTPVVLMGYLNPFEQMGADNFARLATEAGVDGALIVDLPPEEAETFNLGLQQASIDQVYLVAPNSTRERIELLCEKASGFVYFVSVKGVTGGKAVSVDDIRQQIDLTRQISGIPVGLGFGIRNPQAAADAAAIADAIIVGSAIVEIIEKNGAAHSSEQEVEQFTAALREAIDKHRSAA